MTNKDLIQNYEEFSKQVENDFIGENFIDQLEWSMLMIRSRFKQMHLYEYLNPITSSTFNKAYLLSSEMNDNIEFLRPFTEYQCGPYIFPLINIKLMLIGETITLSKCKELSDIEKRGLNHKYRHVYSRCYAFYKKDTESFYAEENGYELGDNFFRLGHRNANEKLCTDSVPNPISLKKGYRFVSNAIKYIKDEDLIETSKSIAISYQIALSLFYEWSVYIKEKDNLGFVIPINPEILREIYNTSMMKFESRKAMLHFVKEHYRRRVARPDEEYSIFVNRYLRGENKFDFRGFYAEIIPPKYELNRVKTRKKIIDVTKD